MKKIISYLLALLAVFILAFALYLWISDCGISPFRCGEYPTQSNITTQKIAVGGGPEDMAVDYSQGVPRLIVSCEERRPENQKKGGFYGIDLSTHTSYQFQIKPADFEIFPHGIDIVTMDSTTYLYAISHHQDGDNWRHPVYRFIIQGNTLVYNQTYEHTLMNVPNDLDVLADGSFYATNYVPSMNPTEMNKAIMGSKNGSIVYFDGKGNWEIAAKDLCIPNGIYMDEGNNHLYVANGGCHEVLQFEVTEGKINASSKQSTIVNGPKITLGDNLLKDQQGQLWAVAHPCPLDFAAHTESKEEQSPTQIFTIDPTTLQPKTVFQNDGGLISAASTAVNINNQLYVSQVYEPYVLVVKGVAY